MALGCFGNHEKTAATSKQKTGTHRNRITLEKKKQLTCHFGFTFKDMIVWIGYYKLIMHLQKNVNKVTDCFNVLLYKVAISLILTVVNVCDSQWKGMIG